METGKAVYQLIEKGGDEAYDWIRASASMPVVSKIVELNGRKLLDGGAVYDIGRTTTEQQLEQIKRFWDNVSLNE